MKKIKLSISDDSGNIDFNESPIWRHSKKLNWIEAKEELGLSNTLRNRLSSWQWWAIQLNEKFCRDERVECEVEGLSILLELRKELPDYQITYSSNFNSYNCVLNEEQIDDSY